MKCVRKYMFLCLCISSFPELFGRSASVRGEEALVVEETCRSQQTMMLQPRARIGEVIGNGLGQYQLTEFVRVQGDEPHPERHQVDPVFFTPVLNMYPPLLPSPELSLSLTAQGKTELCSLDSVGGSWRLNKRTNRGAHGEVWRGTKINPATKGDSTVYVLKRMLLEKGEKVRLAAAREKFFGELMWAEEFTGHVARYVESFTNVGKSGEVTELWLVFVDEGISLHEWLYTPVDFNGGSILLQSEAWQRMRTSKHAKAQMQELVRQIFASTLALHSRNITHRDLKTSNVVWRLRSKDDAAPHESSLFVVLIDFSSAYSLEAAWLFGEEGPSLDEETRDSLPPERVWSHDAALTPRPSFDSWSIGVLILELLLGTQSVFTVDQRTRAMLTWKLRHETEEELEKALFKSALGDFCIIEPIKPVHSGEVGKDAAGSEEGMWEETGQRRCGMTELAGALQRRDPLEVGYGEMLGEEGLHFLSQLLKWEPEDRLTAQQALDHPFLRLGGHSASGLSSQALQSSFSSFGNHFGEEEVKQPKEQLCLSPPSDEDSCLTPHTPQQFVLSDKFDVGPYRCPKCGRVFDVYDSCLRHATTRGHSLWCDHTNDANNMSQVPSTISPSSYLSPAPLAPAAPKLPSCLSSHSLQDKLSGWCDVQGRRLYLEDHGAVVYASDCVLWSVFDGHVKASAAQFAAHFLPAALARHVKLGDPTKQQVRAAFLETDAALLAEQRLQFQKSHEKSLVPFPSRVKGAESAGAYAWFRKLFNRRKAREEVTDIGPTAGTTATVAMLTRSGQLVVANVGDSRAVLCCDREQAVVLSVDHTASDKDEASRVEALGARIVWGHDDSGGLARVNGEVAVTRSLGDASLKKFLIAEPHVSILNLTSAGPHFEFLVVATDGLWDVISSQQVADYVKARRGGGMTWQQIATALTHEALLRGSLDNVGVCVIDVKNRIPR